MTRMIFVRHGESPGNHLRRFFGHHDEGLTEVGQEQANRAGEYLKDTKIDAAYASDLPRAFETGERVLAHHEGVTPIPDAQLREIFAGQWENVPFSELDAKFHEDYEIWMSDPWNSGPTGGESVRELTERVRKEVWRIAKEHAGQTVLIATHATPIRTMICEWMGEPYENMKQFNWVKNASVSIVDYDTDNETTNIVLLGETSFLGDLVTALPKNV